MLGIVQGILSLSLLFQVFGMQYFGECWGGNADTVQYDKYGIAPPQMCWNGVGKHWTNYVYKIIQGQVRKGLENYVKRYGNTTPESQLFGCASKELEEDRQTIFIK